MTREYRIRNNATTIFWKEKLKKYLSHMNLEFEEIMLIEEVDPFNYYIAHIKVNSHSEKNKFIEVIVTFNVKGQASISIYPILLDTINLDFSYGNILLNKL